MLGRQEGRETISRGPEEDADVDVFSLGLAGDRQVDDVFPIARIGEDLLLFVAPNGDPENVGLVGGAFGLHRDLGGLVVARPQECDEFAGEVGLRCCGHGVFLC